MVQKVCFIVAFFLLFLTCFFNCVKEEIYPEIFDSKYKQCGIRLVMCIVVFAVLFIPYYYFLRPFNDGVARGYLFQHFLSH